MLKLASNAAVEGVPASATCLSRMSIRAKPAQVANSQPQLEAACLASGSLRALTAAMASRPKASPPSFQALAGSPNSRKAAPSDSSSDRRWATSLRTMPASRTARASTRKMPGRATPRPSRASHGALPSRRDCSDGFSSNKESTPAAR